MQQDNHGCVHVIPVKRSGHLMAQWLKMPSLIILDVSLQKYSGEARYALISSKL